MSTVVASLLAALLSLADQACLCQVLAHGPQTALRGLDLRGRNK
jgi:hypothetical protein